MPIMSVRFPGHKMHAGEMREQLGLGIKGKLPREGMSSRNINGYEVTVVPQHQEIGRGRRGMKHRVLAACPHCGCFIPFGRLAQHEPACPQRDNSTGGV
jgi:hypothetical protein